MSTRSVGRMVLGVAVAWTLGVVCLITEFWPALPRTRTGWATFLLFGPMLYFLAEGLSEKIWSRRPPAAPTPVSAARVVKGILIVLAFGAFTFLAAWFIARH